MNCPHVPYKVYLFANGKTTTTEPKANGKWSDKWVIAPYSCPICGMPVLGGQPHPPVTDPVKIQAVLEYATEAIKEQKNHGTKETTILDLCVANIVGHTDARKLLGITKEKLGELLEGRGKWIQRIKEA